MAGFVQRMVGAARLDVRTYEEVEADRGATGQALGVVLLAAVAAGIGGLGTEGAEGPLMAAVGALAGWFLWAGLVYLVGVKLLPEPQTQADFGQLLRTIGFSASPGILRLFGFIPILGALVGAVASVWMLIAMVIAVRQALDYRSTARAIAVCVLGFIVYAGVVLVVGLLVGRAPWSF